MDSTQNDKLLQINPETLVVGIDAGKNKHFVPHARILSVIRICPDPWSMLSPG
ncbi:hypothetical protein [Proteiniclasticum sp.]|uniref:hypothetical protein n=1 Tax=Proteiniclasticum sp. TaxID=2053595 RepID=UPI00289E39EE|nr:hypothetical protein [Proteiniclasticum sp.]